MMRVPLLDPPITIRQVPSALCRSLSDEFNAGRVGLSTAFVTSAKFATDVVSSISIPWFRSCAAFNGPLYQDVAVRVAPGHGQEQSSQVISISGPSSAYVR